MGDAILQQRVHRARERTLAFLRAMEVGPAPLVSRFSAAHDIERWPGMLLPGTYNAVMCGALLGALPAQAARRDAAGWLLRHRRQDGTFRIPGMTAADVYKKPDPAETWAYIDFHVTNYTLGALDVLDTDATPSLGFAAPFLAAGALADWLAKRDWNDPWQEGNNLVNLASFLLLIQRSSDVRAQGAAIKALTDLITHLEETQNPRTGFWGRNQDAGEPLLHAMAGAMHIFHLWYLLGRPLPHQREAVGYTLTLPSRTTISACLDVDAVDLIFHGAATAEGPAVDRWMREKLIALLDAQNEDGGFFDTRDGTLRFDGWVRGYEEPQGGSNTFATWFRWVAIALICEHLWPGWHRFRFRRMIGIGYARTIAVAHAGE